MNRFRIFLVFLCIVTGGRNATARPFHAVFDLDWTLLYTTTEEAAAIDPSGVLKIDGTLYRFADQAAEVVLALHRAGFRVSFFSGGNDARNNIVVEELYKRVDRLSAPGERYRPYTVASYNRLTTTGAPPTAPFTDRFKKDIESIDAPEPVGDVVLADDSDFAAKGQERNLLRLVDTYNDIPDYETWKEGRAEGVQLEKFDPPSRLAWSLERHKLVRVVGTLMTAKAEADQTGEPLAEVVQRIAPQIHEMTRVGLQFLSLPETSLTSGRRPITGPCGATKIAVGGVRPH